jgi:putative VirB-like lipoprotein
MRRLLVAALSALALTGCPGAHSAYPSRNCKLDTDCYVGEVCMAASTCVATSAAADLAVPSTEDLAEPPTGGDS